MVHLKNNISYYLIIIHCLLLHCRFNVNTDTSPQCDIMMTKYEDMLLIFIKMYGQDWPGNWAVAAPGVRIWALQTVDTSHRWPGAARPLDTFILLSDLSSQTVQVIVRILQYVTVRECANIFRQTCASEVST